MKKLSNFCVCIFLEARYYRRKVRWKHIWISGMEWNNPTSNQWWRYILLLYFVSLYTIWFDLLFSHIKLSTNTWDSSFHVPHKFSLVLHLMQDCSYFDSFLGHDSKVDGWYSRGFFWWKISKVIKFITKSTWNGWRYFLVKTIVCLFVFGGEYPCNFKCTSQTSPPFNTLN